MISGISKNQIVADLKILITFLKVFLRAPFENIKKLPPIHWQSGLIFVFGLNILFGMARAIFSPSLLSAIVGFFITPILAVILMSLTTLFLVYFFQFILNKIIPYGKLFNILLAAYIPGCLFFFGSIFYAPLFVLGVVTTSSLLVMGLVENLEIPKKLGVRLVVVGGMIVMVFWLAQMIFERQANNDLKSLDELEKEIQTMGQ